MIKDDDHDTDRHGGEQRTPRRLPQADETHLVDENQVIIVETLKLIQDAGWGELGP
ncbi:MULTISPECIES: hypothetical protein [Exiguobacterium]|uniref:hypothetical protein n=1 Tax=Exiguobacterium TaxID=33986 RepID=UPI001375D3C8|nr:MULTISPECIES: hypothetical protein [Exiguobacterium]